MVFSARQLVPVVLVPDAYSSDEVHVRWQVPSSVGDNCYVVGMSVDARARLLDHHVLNVKHDDLEHVQTGIVSSVEYGPHLGAMSGYHGFDAALETYGFQRRPKLWAGVGPHVEGEACIGRPARIPLVGGREFTVRLKRLYGAASIAAFTLWVLVDTPSEASNRDRCGRRALFNRPRWVVAAASLPAASLRVRSEVNVTCHDGRVLHVKQHVPYALTGPGSMATNADALTALKASITGSRGELLVPAFGAGDVAALEYGAPMLQDADCLRTPGLLIGDRETLGFEFSHAADGVNTMILWTLAGAVRDAA